MLWCCINEQLGRIKTQNNAVKLSIEGKLTVNVAECCNHFSNYFSSAVQEKLIAAYGSSLSDMCTVGISLSSSLYFSPVTHVEVSNAIRDLRTVRSVGWDDVSVECIKFVEDTLCKPLAIILNRSVELGSFPNVLKVAKVTPVFKKGDSNSVANYRPISVCSVFSKIFETIIKKRLLDFFDTYKVLCKSQHGFREGLSTETATVDYFSYVYRHLDRGDYVIGLFFDLSRAFDSLPPHFIEQKLYSVGIRGNILKWLTSFITDRRLRVVLSGTASEESSVDLGVPQGSILGPLIFLIFVNDLPRFLEDVHVVMYADDTSIAVAARDREELEVKVKNVIERFTDWCTRNRIILNIQKTVCVNFNIRRPLSIECFVGLSLQKQACFLGLTVDDGVTFKPHIDNVCKKLNSSYFALLKLKSSLNSQSLLNAYYALCYSHLSYNNLLWSRSTEWRRVFVAQKRIIRLIFGLQSSDSCREVFKIHGILTFPSIYILKAVVYVNTNRNRYKTYVSQRETRHLDLPLLQHRTTFFEKSPEYDFVKLFNKLPASIKKITTPNIFKNTVKTFLLENGFYSLREYLSDG